jgi:oligopeptide transport system substrate-binding protein
MIKIITSVLVNICVILISLTTIFCLNSCSDKTSQIPLNTFKYNLAVGLNSLDPAFAKDLAATWACSHIYEGLFILDSNADLEPLLTDSFWLEPNQVRYHFKLKHGVYFHKNLCFQTKDSTRLFNAHDVVYSLKRLLDPKTASPGSWVLRNKLDSISPYQIIDSFHLVIQLQQPNAQFLQVLSMPYCAIVPKEAIDYYGKNFRKNPVGTGAFSFKLWEDGEVLFLKKNQLYHCRDIEGTALPYLDYVKISFNENKKTELFSFEKNELSFITGLDQNVIHQVFNPNGNLLPKWSKKAQLYKIPFLNTEYMAIRLVDSFSILKNKEIRKAMNYSINRTEIAQYLKYNLVLPAEKGFVSNGMPNYDTSFTGYTFNLNKAKNILQTQGYSNTNKPKLELHINNNFIELAELLTNQLTDAGFILEIKLHPADMMMQLAAEGKLGFFRRSWMADYPDAENYLACFYSKNGSPPNYTRFSNPDYDKLYERLIREMQPEERKQIVKQMELILIEEAPIVTIFYDQSIRLVQKNIAGLKQNVVNSLDLRRVKIAK